MKYWISKGLDIFEAKHVILLISINLASFNVKFKINPVSQFMFESHWEYDWIILTVGDENELKFILFALIDKATEGRELLEIHDSW